MNTKLSQCNFPDRQKFVFLYRYLLNAIDALITSLAKMKKILFVVLLLAITKARQLQAHEYGNWSLRIADNASSISNFFVDTEGKVGEIFYANLIIFDFFRPARGSKIGIQIPNSRDFSSYQANVKLMNAKVNFIKVQYISGLEVVSNFEASFNITFGEHMRITIENEEMAFNVSFNREKIKDFSQLAKAGLFFLITAIVFLLNKYCLSKKRQISYLEVWECFGAIFEPNKKYY